MTEAPALPQPSDTDIEHALLGALFFTPRAIIYTKNGGITQDSFFDPRHSIIYGAMYELYEDAGCFDQLTLADKLRENGKLDLVGGEIALSGLIPDIDNTVMVKHYIEKLREKELLRREWKTFTTLRDLSLTASDGNKVLETAVSKLKDIQDEFGDGKHSLTAKIKSFVESATGTFSISEITRYLSKNTLATPQNIITVLTKLTTDGFIARVGDRHGYFRKVEDDCPIIDLRNLDFNPLPLKWPFEIEKYVDIMSGNICVVAGAQNAGKTIFCLNFAKLNMKNSDVHYFSSEMGGREILRTLRRFDGLRPMDWTVKFRERADNFADVVVPDAINVIDFLEVHDDFYLIGKMIREIFDAMRGGTGMVLIAIQKDPKSEDGRGGSISKEKARLYMTMDYNKKDKRGVLTITKAKNWASDINPNWMYMNFEFTHGGGFRYSDWSMP